jgi:hypothetical protein
MIRKLILLVTIIFLNGFQLFSQINNENKSLDSLYDSYVSSESQAILPEGISTQNSHEVKCGFGLASEIKRNFERFSSQQQAMLAKLLQRTVKQTSMVSPSGFFRIHYDTTGLEVPNYNSSLTIQENVFEVALALDSTYNFEVIFLGYLKPPPDNNEGGDNRYDVYISSASGNYGFTQPETPLGNQKYTSYMEIHYDFKNFYTKGLNAMRVTVAHEFHHAIQLGSYTGDKADIDLFFYEMSSTAMEEFVYDNVNDYYAYMPSYFSNPQKAFAENSGYSLAIWNIYLKENFGFGIIKKQWELMPTQRALNAINISLSEENTSFKHELNQFGVWTYHTKYRAVPGKYFEEASNYPLIRPMSTIAFTSPDEVVTIKSKATANNFIRFTNQMNSDTLYVLITNGDVQGAVSNISKTDSIAYYLYDYPESGANKIDSTYYSKFTTTTPSFWVITEISDTIIRIIEPQLKTDFPYPMPFSYKLHSAGKISIPVSTNNNNIGLYIFSTAMELVYSNDDETRDAQNRNIISWRVRDNQNRKLASGVYVYVIKSGNEVEKGKLVILHD